MVAATKLGKARLQEGSASRDTRGVITSHLPSIKAGDAAGATVEMGQPPPPPRIAGSTRFGYAFLMTVGSFWLVRGGAPSAFGRGEVGVVEVGGGCCACCWATVVVGEDGTGFCCWGPVGVGVAGAPVASDGGLPGVLVGCRVCCCCCPAAQGRVPSGARMSPVAEGVVLCDGSGRFVEGAGGLA